MIIVGCEKDPNHDIQKLLQIFKFCFVFLFIFLRAFPELNDFPVLCPLLSYLLPTCIAENKCS